jgi:hypothetical protein
MLLMMTLCAVVFVQMAAAAPPKDACALPPGLLQEISLKYPRGKVVSLADLTQDDKTFFQKDHGAQCPGLVKADFYGDGKSTFAVVLIEGKPSKQTTRLIVAHKLGPDWKLQSLETSDAAPVPVVWSEAPGRYRDVYGERTIRATHSVIVFCGYEGWAILYAWVGSKTEKIWIMD